MNARVRFAAVTAAAALLAGVAAPAAAQAGRVSGTVTNASTGEALVGAQVSVRDREIGTVTDGRGRYLLLNVPAGAQTIDVHMIGFATRSQQVTVPEGGAVTANFEMQTEAISLDAVVATGTASQARRREVGNAISLISAKDIEETAVVDVTDVLQGKAAGVSVLDRAGYAGAGAMIRLRGVNTLTSGVRPLVYVDGIRIESGPHGNPDESDNGGIALDDLDPHSIERIEIIKGAAATTLYGTEAASGVIQIFTKAGGGGAPAWTFSMDQGFSELGHIGPEEDPTGMSVNDCSAEPGCPASGSWLKTGHLQNYILSVRGGDNVPYYVSASWGRQDGVLATEQSATNLNVRANFTFEPLANLKIRSSSMFSRRDIVWIPDGNNAEGFLINVMRGERGYTPGNDDSLLFEMDIDQMIDHFISSANIAWTPTSGMLHRLNIGLDYSSSDYLEERPWGYYSTPDGDRESDLELDRNWTVDYAGNWNTALPFGNLVSTLSWGAQYFDEFSWGINGFGEQFAGPGDKLLESGVITSANEAWTRVASGGFFLQEQIGWNDRLFVTLGGRWDGFSTFGEDFGLAFYPKISAAYTISDHDFWPQWWETMKLRGALGESGRAPGTFDAQRTWASVSGDENRPGVILSEIGNPGLGPERTREIESGFEGSMLDGRLSFDVTYFDQLTYDALFDLVRPTSIGTEQPLTTNLGEIENKGFELMTNVTVLRRPNLTWDVGGHYSVAKNEVVKLNPEVTDDRRLGRPIDAIFDDVVQNPAEFARPDYEEEYIGPWVPKHNFALNTRLTLFRDLTLSALAEGAGDYFHIAGTTWAQVNRLRWAPCNYVFEAVAAGDLSNITALERAHCHPSQRSLGTWTKKADFVKLRSLSASYRVPERFLFGGASAMTLRVQGRNLHTWTDYPGLDPEGTEDGPRDISDTREYYQLPIPSQFVFNVTVNF
ncbi:MAG: TonB-dependent receptor domain-containing protein [Longimicrobiales bacterium]